MIFQIDSENVGYNGFTKRDIGKWCVMVQGCTHLFKTEILARECAAYIK
jgi:hypothetical protein